MVRLSFSRSVLSLLRLSPPSLERRLPLGPTVSSSLRPGQEKTLREGAEDGGERRGKGGW